MFLIYLYPIFKIICDAYKINMCNVLNIFDMPDIYMQRCIYYMFNTFTYLCVMFKYICSMFGYICSMFEYICSMFGEYLYSMSSGYILCLPVIFNVFRKTEYHQHNQNLRLLAPPERTNQSRRFRGLQITHNSVFRKTSHITGRHRIEIFPEHRTYIFEHHTHICESIEHIYTALHVNIGAYQTYLKHYTYLYDITYN